MTVAQAFTVNVWVTEVWDIVSLDVTPDWTVTRLKHAALERATGRTPDPSRYTVKFRGAAVLDESVTLGALQTPNGAPFIVLPTRRQPVR